MKDFMRHLVEHFTIKLEIWFRKVTQTSGRPSNSEIGNFFSEGNSSPINYMLSQIKIISVINI